MMNQNRHPRKINKKLNGKMEIRATKPPGEITRSRKSGWEEIEVL